MQGNNFFQEGAFTPQAVANQYANPNMGLNTPVPVGRPGMIPNASLNSGFNNNLNAGLVSGIPLGGGQATGFGSGIPLGGSQATGFGSYIPLNAQIGAQPGLGFNSGFNNQLPTGINAGQGFGFPSEIPLSSIGSTEIGSGFNNVMNTGFVSGVPLNTATNIGMSAPGNTGFISEVPFSSGVSSNVGFNNQFDNGSISGIPLNTGIGTQLGTEFNNVPITGFQPNVMLDRGFEAGSITGINAGQTENFVSEVPIGTNLSSNFNAGTELNSGLTTGIEREFDSRLNLQPEAGAEIITDNEGLINEPGVSAELDTNSGLMPLNRPSDGTELITGVESGIKPELASIPEVGTSIDNEFKTSAESVINTSAGLATGTQIMPEKELEAINQPSTTIIESANDTGLVNDARLEDTAAGLSTVAGTGLATDIGLPSSKLESSTHVIPTTEAVLIPGTDSDVNAGKPTSCKGTYIFRPLEGKFLKDKDVIGKMDPYVQIKIGLHKGKSVAVKNQGQIAFWDDVITLERKHFGEVAKIKVKDKDTFIDDKVGEVDIPLVEIARKGMIDQWYPIYNKDNMTGEVHLNITFEPTV